MMENNVSETSHSDLAAILRPTHIRIIGVSSGYATVSMSSSVAGDLLDHDCTRGGYSLAGLNGSLAFAIHD